MVDAGDLKSPFFGSAGSSPAGGMAKKRERMDTQLTVEILNQINRAVAYGSFEVGPDGVAYALACGEWVPEDVAEELTSTRVHVLCTDLLRDKDGHVEGVRAMIFANPGGDNWIQSTVRVTLGGDRQLVPFGEDWMREDLKRASEVAQEMDEDFDRLAFESEILASINTLHFPG
jgi:hypothetical protein